jgi:signal transduction histidine kinase
MKYISLTLIVVLACLSARAQSFPQKRDSLKKVLAHTGEDTVRAILFKNIAKTFDPSHADEQDSAIKYIELCGQVSAKADYQKGLFFYYIVGAPMYGYKGKLDKCIELSEKGITLCKKNNQRVGLTNALFNIAGAYAEMGQLDNALNYYLQTDTALQDLNDTVRMSLNSSKICLTYVQLQQYEKAYSYGMKAINLANAIHYEDGLTGGLLHTADALENLEKNDSALMFYREAEALYKKENDDYDIVCVLVDISNLQKKTGKYDELLANGDTVIALAGKIGDSAGICEGNILISYHYFFGKEFDKALPYALKAEEIAKTLNDPKHLYEAYKALTLESLGIGNIPEYNRYSHLEDSVHDKIVSDEIIKNSQMFETRYNVAQKEHDLQRKEAALKAERLQTLMLGLALGLVIIIVIVTLVASRNRRRLLLSEQELQRQKIDKLETEKQLLATQSVVQGQEEERSRIARDLHDGLGGILSGAKYSLSNMKENLIITPETAASFERTMNMLDLSIKEMRRVAHNMMPESLMKLGLNEALQDYCEQVNNSGAISVNYQSSDMNEASLNDTQKITVYRIVQELVNNVIRHAEATTAIVQVFMKNSLLYITVEDNGKGFDKSILLNPAGIGYKNIKSRIDYLNGKIDVQSTVGKGTSIYVEIPLS